MTLGPEYNDYGGGGGSGGGENYNNHIEQSG
jgi:hypothetical protein